MDSVPEHLRTAVAAEIHQLVIGSRPEMLLWVREYGTHGAILIPQPDVIFQHRGPAVVDH